MLEGREAGRVLTPGPDFVADIGENLVRRSERTRAPARSAIAPAAPSLPSPYGLAALKPAAPNRYFAHRPIQGTRSP